MKTAAPPISKDAKILGLKTVLKKRGFAVPALPPGSKASHVEILTKAVASSTALAAKAQASSKVVAAPPPAPAPEATWVEKYNAIKDPGERTEFYRRHEAEFKAEWRAERQAKAQAPVQAAPAPAPEKQASLFSQYEQLGTLAEKVEFARKNWAGLRREAKEAQA